jgi:hypothetical protein
MSEDAKTYRERAHHARLGAREAITPQHRQVFQKLAASYEAMAMSAERPDRATTQDASPER